MSRLTKKGKIVGRPEDRVYVESRIKKSEYIPPVLNVGAGCDTNLDEVFPEKELFRQDIQRLARVDYVCDICNCKELSNCQFGTILCFSLLEHICNPSKAISEIYRILKSPGLLFLFVPLHWRVHQTKDVKDYWRFCPEGIRLLLAKFKVLDLKVEGFETEADANEEEINYKK